MSPQSPVQDRHPGHATGPRTPEGKRRVSRNAVTHGLTCRDVLLPEDDAGEFERFRQALIADGQPVGAEEQILVERMVAAHWRLQRLWRQETGVFGLARLRLGDPLAHVGVCLLKDLNEEQGFTHLARHEAALNREYHRCSRRLQELQALRRKGLRHVIEEDGAEPAREAEVQASDANPASSSFDTPSREIAEQTPSRAAGAPHEPYTARSDRPTPAAAVKAPLPEGAPRCSYSMDFEEIAEQTPLAGAQATEPLGRAAA